MNSKLLYFAIGVVAGSAATFFILRNRVNQEIDERVNDILGREKEAEENRIEKEQTFESPKDIARRNEQRKADLITSSNIINGQQYNLFSNPPKAKDIHNGIDEGEDLEIELSEDYEDIVDSTPPKEGLAERPYTITPQQFVNEQQYFDKITLEYFDDGILCNELEDEVLTDIDRDVGEDSLTKFGEFEEDVVYVRNEKTSTDYEIIHQHRNFYHLPGEDY